MSLPFNCFDPASAPRSERLRNVYAVYELDEATTYLATWLFVFGSLLFCIKPTLRLIREVHLWRVGGREELAKRARAEL